MQRVGTAVAVLAAAMAVPALAAQDEFHWQKTLARGSAIEIKGVNGGITATGTSGSAVEVSATKKGRRSDPAQVKVEVVEHAGGVTICAVYPSVGGQPNSCVPGKGGRMKTRDSDVQVDFQVKVPAGVRFVGRTVNGSVSATGIAADAEAETVNGGVNLDAAGTARGSTVNGGVTARLGRADWDGALKLSTVNGGIELTLPDGLNAEVKASTVNGDIETDFPLAVSGRISRRAISGTIGSGGRQLELSTVNGGIALRKAGAKKSAGR
ncbi:MAG: DUF4097 family beta strand repeat-containing protein [Betaproteobacteria bacterium]